MTQEKEAWSSEEKADDDFQIKAHGKLDEHTTMLAGMVHIGRVVEAATDDATEPGDIPRVLVHIGTNEVGGYVRNWLPWVTARAGYDGEWWRPDIDEQVLVLAPSGNLVQGFIVGSIYRGALTFDSEAGDIKPRDAIPGTAEGAAATEKYTYRRVYRDGSSLSYDPSAHQLAVALKATPKDANSALAFSAIAPDEKKGEVSLQTSLQAVLIAGTVDDPKVTVKANAGEANSLELNIGDGSTHIIIKSDGTVILASGGSAISVKKDGLIDIQSAGDINIKGGKINMTGDVIVKGTLDVQ